MRYYYILSSVVFKEKKRERVDYIISELSKVNGNVGYNLVFFGMYVCLVKLF